MDVLSRPSKSPLWNRTSLLELKAIRQECLSASHAGAFQLEIKSKTSEPARKRRPKVDTQASVGRILHQRLLQFTTHTLWCVWCVHATIWSTSAWKNSGIFVELKKKQVNQSNRMPLETWSESRQKHWTKFVCLLGWYFVVKLVSHRDLEGLFYFFSS